MIYDNQGCKRRRGRTPIFALVLAVVAGQGFMSRDTASHAALAEKESRQALEVDPGSTSHTAHRGRTGS